MTEHRKCQFCRHSVWGKLRRSTGKPDYSKPGLCIAVTDKRVIVSAASSCERWEKHDETCATKN